MIEDYGEMFMRKQTPADEVQPSTQRQKNQYNDNFRDLMVDQILQYDFNVRDDHQFTVLGGFNYLTKTNSIVSVGSQRANNDYDYTISEPPTTVVNGVVVPNVTSFGTTLKETRSASFFGQFHYDYNTK